MKTILNMLLHMIRRDHKVITVIAMMCYAFITIITILTLYSYFYLFPVWIGLIIIILQLFSIFKIYSLYKQFLYIENEILGLNIALEQNDEMDILTDKYKNKNIKTLKELQEQATEYKLTQLLKTINIVFSGSCLIIYFIFV